MPSINISEKDFDAVACAAMDAQDRGDIETAKMLDKIARKMNAALSEASVPRPMGRVSKPLSWKDMPSVIVTRI